MLEDFGFVTLTHPQKNMPIFVDVLEIAAIEPYIFQETSSYDEDGNEILDEEEATKLFQEGKLKTKFEHHFISTVIKLKDKVELHVKERPNLVAKRMRKVMDAKSE